MNSKLLADASLLGTRSSDKVGVEECGQIEEMIKLPVPSVKILLMASAKPRIHSFICSI